MPSVNKANNGFGKLPKERGNSRFIYGTILTLIYLATVVSYRAQTQTGLFSFDDLGLTCAVISSLLLSQFIRTILLFSEEKQHIDTRYSQSTSKAMLACIPFPKIEITVMVFVISSIVTYVYWNDSTNVIFNWPAYIVVAFINIFHRQGLSKAEISHLNETENKHVADGLAWSYYFGYLKIMLPALDRMVSDAVKPNFDVGGYDLRDVISCRKVFIVIPKNCYCYESFEKVDPRITFKTSMPPQRRTRGGVQERVYKNSLYQLQVTDDSEPLYILMEYATPVLSMYDMMMHTGAKFSQDDLENQVKEFSIKLKEILDNDPDCKDKYELVLVGKAHSNLADVIDQTVNEKRIGM